MAASKSDIIARLELDLLSLQGLKHMPGSENSVDLGVINQAFPNKTFPVGAIHEFISTGMETSAATTGFISGILSQLIRNNGVVIWISSSRMVFPPALGMFGIAPERIIFIDLRNENDCLWAMEEALKCEGLAAVVSEIKELSFTASRRFQLAVEQSRVTGFVMRYRPKKPGVTACVSRWRILPISSELEEDMPGVGFPRWQIELLKIRNGKPGHWQMEWSDGRFRQIGPAYISFETLRRKTGS
jgi:protein ImuA